MVHLTCHFMCKILYTHKHTNIHMQHFKVCYLMMHDLLLITLNWLFKIMGRHSLPPLKRISSRDSVRKTLKERGVDKSSKPVEPSLDRED